MYICISKNTIPAYFEICYLTIFCYYFLGKIYGDVNPILKCKPYRPNLIWSSVASIVRMINILAEYLNAFKSTKCSCHFSYI